MTALRLSPEAETDLEDMWRYVSHESHSTKRADRFLDRFSIFFLRLLENPYLGRRRDDLRPGYRSFPVGEYLVINRVSASKEVLILRIIHGSRDVPSLIEG